MFKKVVLPLIAAVILAVSLSGTALAAEGDEPGRIKARGEVIAVDPVAGKFRVENKEGEVFTFFVNENTSFRGLDSLTEMQVGWKAGVAAREVGGKFWAVLVIAGEPLDLHQVRGRVVGVNTSAGKFSIETPSGEELRFFVDERTRYGGQISSLEELEEGMGAGVVYKGHSEGKLIAVGLVAGHAPDLVKARGEITAVEPRLGKFEILTAGGERMRFSVDENTRYQGQLTSLDEMQVGWKAAVAAREEDGQLTAVLVIAGIRPEPVRAQGLIVGVDPAAGTFRLEKADGSVLTFFVNERTTYKGQASGISELKEGMRAGVGGFENQDGNLVARVVLTGTPPDERPEIIRARGIIKTVNPGAEKFQLEKSDGSVLTVYVDGRTGYRGQVSDFDGLEKGMRVGFAGYVDSDGKITARLVIAGNPRSDRQRGEGPAPEIDTPREDRIQIPLT
ncbi:MAG: hypothetical protein DRI46_03155 [Chloroflexi bacterium]|nr:MAG: hypothetical protein DRI46_03155 [Chloroflexota bacterium]